MDNINQENNENNIKDLDDILQYINPSDELNLDDQNFHLDNSDEIILNLPNEMVEIKESEEKKENQILNISEFDLKIKFQSICSSLEFFNINQKNTKILKDSLSYISESKEKIIIIIDNLLNSFIDVFNRIKEDDSIKDNLMNKINSITKNTDDYEKKILKLKKEIIAKENEIGSIINKNQAEKEKMIDTKKSKNYEINTLKNENRKLVNVISICKNELKKKDDEIERIKKKIDLIQTGNINNKSTNKYHTNENLIKRCSTTINENNNNNNKDQYKELNLELIKLIQFFNIYINKFYMIIQNEKKEEKSTFYPIDNTLVKNIKLDNIQFFKNNFKTNLEELLKIINNKQKLIKNPSKTKLSFSYDNEELNKQILQQQNKNSEWYKHCFGQIVKYKFDKNNVIYDNENEEQGD
jgi:hypothetical protein